MLKKLHVFSVLKSEGRNTSVDIFRGIAILVVVLFHFNHILPFGYLGVDLFFVISGLLVGGLITKEFDKSGRVNFPRFFLQRGFKIWPSYYFFLIVGTALAYSFYYESHPDQLIHWNDSFRYIFFYQNYTGEPLHWSFDHVWSLCVEEHFYILLPVMFLFVQNFINKKYSRRLIYILIIGAILAGISFKAVSWFFTTGKDTYSATHNRIDALSWGVLLNLIITDYGHLIKKWVKLKLFFISGVILFAFAIYLHNNLVSDIYQKIIFHSIVPVCFFLMLLGMYFSDFSKWYLIRFIAYYSYNWYLWHPPFVFIITGLLGVTITGVIVFLLVSFSMAVISTTLVEEYFLKRRSIVLQKLFPNG